MNIHNQNVYNTFSQAPNEYLLQVKTREGEQELSLLKKGFWTWIKINIGSHLGFLSFFDRTTLSLNDVANVLRKLPDQNQDFSAIDAKIIKWNGRHVNGKVSDFDISRVAAWNDLEEEQIVEKIRQSLNNSPCNETCNSLDVRKRDDSYLIHLEMSSLNRPRLGKQRIQSIDTKKLMDFIMGDSLDGSAELLKVANQTRNLNLIISKTQNKVLVKFTSAVTTHAIPIFRKIPSQ